jgi:TonB family protein
VNFAYIYKQTIPEMTITARLIAVILLFLSMMNTMSYAQGFTPARPYSDQKLLQDFLCAEVVYPGEELSSGIEGKVVISFIVEQDGSVTNVNLKEKVDPELDKEALRLFRMILWEPAVSLGQPVASQNEFPFDFNIKKYNKHCKQRGYGITEFPYEPVDSAYKVYEPVNIDRKPYALFDEKGMSLNKFIANNIRYPDVAFRQSISGKVLLRFVVEPQGRASNIQVIEPVGGGCTQEAIRLLQMIRWMPGIKDQAAVRTFMKLEIEFKLPDDSKMQMFDSQLHSN